MSRTFRRKNAEDIMRSSWNQSKVAGYYTEYERDPERGHYYGRLPTAEELFLKFRNLHCDGNRHYRFEGMPKWGRRLEMKTDRAKHRAKITRFLKGLDDDVVVEKLPKFPYRYW